ncbi:hypothetical protein [Nonomuraea guangzhouensis]|uniref:DUF4365 domain-containing protein n=1 Tax=Nonomuraea guangzhouensis TaxID=1291555 RepID=A0ABW4GCJ5_9ACTN|nr:hypothetical protein [Nonomuraea guangzhouensis]
MITPLHEGLVGITTLDPGHTAHMLRALFALPIPVESEASRVCSDLSEAVPAPFRADAALLYGDEPSTKLGVIVEVQLSDDKEKHWSWLSYIASLRARDECPVCLVVICPDRATARWASRPIETGHPGLTLTPLVVGPDNTKAITDVAEAVGNIGLAAVSAITQSNHPEIAEILAALTEALDSLDTGVARRYAEYVTVALKGNAQKEMERLMATETYRYQGEYAQSLRAEGRAEGEVKLLLIFLESRGIALSDGDRKRITTCGDVARLELWAERAALVSTVEELFA